MAYELKKLRPRHHEVIRLLFLGLSHKEIALKLGITPVTVGIVMASPLARFELSKLRSEAERNVVDVSRRADAVRELQSAGLEAIKLNRKVMNSAKVDLKIRTRVAQHFMDRVVFEHTESEDKASYRDILRGLGRLEEKLNTTTIITKAVDVTAEGGGAEQPSQTTDEKESFQELLKKMGAAAAGGAES